MTHRIPLVVALLWAATASAYVRSRTDRGTPVFWSSGCTWIRVDQAGARDLPLSDVEAVLAKAVANWQTVTLDAGCSYLKIHVDPPADGEARLDNLNTVKFRRDKWCRPADKAGAEVCYSAQAAAITTVFYTNAAGKPEDGAIVDADIQFNEVNFTFVRLPTNVVARPGTTNSDFENTLTHELGHFQGLDHTCWDHVTPTPPIDDAGQPIPDCDDVLARNVPPDQYQKIVQATMFNFSSAGETIKRMPKADDIAGICGIYPKAKDPKSCARVGGGCAVGGRSGAWGALLLLALAAVARVRARACSRTRRR